MASHRKAAPFAIAVLIMAAFVATGRAQAPQAQTQPPVKAVQLTGLARVSNNTKGTLTVENGALRFAYSGKSFDLSPDFHARRGHRRRQPAGSPRNPRHAEHVWPLRVGPFPEPVSLQAGHADDSISRFGRRASRRNFYAAGGNGGRDKGETRRCRGAHKRPAARELGRECCASLRP